VAEKDSLRWDFFVDHANRSPTICDHLSKNQNYSLNFCIFKIFFQHKLQCIRSRYLKFQVSSFEALDSRARKEMDLNSNHAQINYIGCHNFYFALMPTVLEFGLKCSSWPIKTVSCRNNLKSTVYFGGGFAKKAVTILFTSIAL